MLIRAFVRAGFRWVPNLVSAIPATLPYSTLPYPGLCVASVQAAAGVQACSQEESLLSLILWQAVTLGV